jgi:hypothetical protein
VNSWSHRPSEKTEISNLFLASDYVKTATDLATMEGANEAGRRAVNAILAAVRSNEEPCELFEFEEPPMFAPLRAADRAFFELGLPHPGLAECPLGRVLRLPFRVMRGLSRLLAPSEPLDTSRTRHRNPAPPVADDRIAGRGSCSLFVVNHVVHAITDIMLDLPPVDWA